MQKSQTSDQLKADRHKFDFEPSMKYLLRIMKFMLENPTRGKTQLSLNTKINYVRLSDHIQWMERKGLAKSSLKDGKIIISLTGNGKVLAHTLLMS
jgi:predicted transcriptional regulator